MYTARGQSVGRRCAGLLLVCSCSAIEVLLRLASRAKRKRALRGRNPPGIPRPTVCHWCIPRWPPPTLVGRGPVFFPAHQRTCLGKIPGVWGLAPKASPLGRLGAAGIASLLLLVLHRLAEPVAFAIHLEDHASVRQPIQ